MEDKCVYVRVWHNNLTGQLGRYRCNRPVTTGVMGLCQHPHSGLPATLDDSTGWPVLEGPETLLIRKD